MNTGFKYERENTPLYPPFLRGNPSNNRHSRDLSIGARRKNLPLTAHQGGRGLMVDLISIIPNYSMY